MKFKDISLEVIDKVLELLESTKTSMVKRHTISPEELYKRLNQIESDISRVQTMLKRENQDI